MATASNPTLTHHSPRSAAAVEGSTITSAAAGTNSPQSRRRGGGAGSVSSPWTQIVRGGDSESTVTSPSAAAAAAAGSAVAPPPPFSSSVPEEQITDNSSSDRSPTKATPEAAVASSASSLPDDDAAEPLADSSDSGSSGNAKKKPVWNKPNGATDVGPVMGAVSWPALSESTRASPKSSSSDSLKAISDASLSFLEETAMASPSSHKQGHSSNANTNSTPNHATFNRQRSMKSSGGGGNPSNNISSNGGFSQLPLPRNSGTEVTPNNSGKHSNSAADSSPRDNMHRDGGQRGGLGSQSHSGNESQQQRSSFRRGSGGPHPRGDGSHHHGYGGRRGGQDRGNQDWNPNRSFGGRDARVQPHRVGSRPFIRGPPPPPPTRFVPPPPMPVRPFATPIVYPEVPSPVFYFPGPPPESIRAVSVVPQLAPVFYAFPDPQLHTKIVNQIDYYFSNENLIKDIFLRQKMDEQGWVPVKLIASFKKVMQLTDNVQFILDAVRTSNVVEVEGEKVRRRNDWIRWIMPPSAQYSTISSPQSMQKSSQDVLSANLQNTTLDEKTPKHGYSQTYLSPSSSGEWSSHSLQSSGEKTTQVAVQGGFTTSVPNPSK